MKAGRARTIIGCLRRAASPDAGLTDGQLLGQYLARRDGGAFAALVRRHGPMVLAVCRRVLRHAQDAEDAFQATFLVLAKKAASVADREAVAAWLHGVACRAAWQARASALRRGQGATGRSHAATHRAAGGRPAGAAGDAGPGAGPAAGAAPAAPGPVRAGGPQPQARRRGSWAWPRARCRAGWPAAARCWPGGWPRTAPRSRPPRRRSYFREGRGRRVCPPPWRFPRSGRRAGWSLPASPPS